MTVIIKEFTESEFACKCGNCNLGYDDMDDKLLSKLFTARKKANMPFIITSAIRCEAHNEKVGGVHDSSHLRGMAVDIRFINGIDLLVKVRELLAAGFRRLGVNWKKKFIHVDVDPGKPQGMFEYK